MLQVVNSTYSTSTDSSSSTYADTGITASITPSSASSKILVLVSCVIDKSDANANNAISMALVRGATIIQQSNDLNFTNSLLRLITPFALTYYDSPNTTSSTTYKMQFRNNSPFSLVRINTNSNIASITLLEIGA